MIIHQWNLQTLYTEIYVAKNRFIGKAFDFVGSLYNLSKKKIYFVKKTKISQKLYYRLIRKYSSMYQ